MATLNDYGQDPNVDEGLGDVIYNSLEDKAKEKTGDLAKKGAKKTAKTANKLINKIGPVRQAKAAVKKAKKKIADGVKKLAREGIKAIGRAVIQGIKALGSFIMANPIVAVVIIIVIFLLLAYMDSKSDDADTNVDNGQTDQTLLESPVYINIDGMSDDDVVVVLMGDCVDQQYDSMDDDLIEMTLEKEQQSKDIFTVFHDYGFNNVTIAGILANIDVESGLDPSAIEGIFSEYGVLGTRKASALTSISAYTEHTLFDMYRKSGISINRDGYRTVNDQGQDVFYCGIGLVQWTGPNAKTLMTAAKNMNIQWYNKEFQLGYMINDNMYRPGFFANWLSAQEPDYEFHIDDYDPANYLTAEAYEEAVAEGKEAAMAAALESAKKSAVYFAHNYEGNTGSDEKRENAALVWYATIFTWCNNASGEDDEHPDGGEKYENDSDTEVRYDEFTNDEYAASITGLAVDLASIAHFVEIEEAQYRCLAGNVYDNSSLSSAGLSIAWPRRELSFNNGTNLYQTILRTIWPTNYTFKACDRTVACAVVWSGTDLDFPLGNTNTQLRYMTTSPKWEFVGTSDVLSEGSLQPGDIFVLNGHTFMYVGADRIQAAYLNECNPGSDSISGSLGKRSAACDSSTRSILNNGGQDWEGRGVYSVFRCCNPDNSDKWKSIGAGMERD